jgi:pimeloyl-ACP methyl ester carboxylesterase
VTGERNSVKFRIGACFFGLDVFYVPYEVKSKKGSNSQSCNELLNMTTTIRPFVLTVALALLSGMICANYAQSKASLGPAPGRLIDVGGHKMHIRCVGPLNAKPTVIFEAGGGGISKDWIDVQELLASHIRSCAYDRAGLGWSEDGPAPRTMRQEVLELHVLLNTAGIHGPFVLAGQSIGGLLVRLYTEQYGKEVAGVVLVDSADENTLVYNVNLNRWVTLRELATGRLVPAPHLTGPPSTGYKPEDDYQAEEAQLLYLRRQATPQPFGDRPLIVLSAAKRERPPGMSDAAYDDLEHARDKQIRDQTTMSQNSILMIAPEGGHNLQIDNPRFVASAIKQETLAVINHTKLTP